MKVDLFIVTSERDTGGMDITRQFRMPFSETVLRHAETEAELQACHPVMRELRPLLQSSLAFLDRVRTQSPQGWRLLAEWRGATPIALAGYRRMDNLVHGRFIYVDDLVTTEAERGSGAGERLLAEIERIARAEDCAKVVLDTGLANSRAQRFYFRCGLLATGLHFTKVFA